jgi:hypothetical protein
MMSQTRIRRRQTVVARTSLLTAAALLAMPSGAGARVRSAETGSGAALATITVTSLADSGPGSLRQAILEANDSPGPDTIVFDLGSGVPSISLLGPLPPITGSTTVDGATGGATRVELNGATAGAGAVALTVSATPCVIRRLVINRFDGPGILVTPTGRCQIEGCHIGTDGAGAADLGNGVGIVLESSGNTVGGAAAGAANVVAFNGTGVIVRTATSAPLNNAIRRNSFFANEIAIDLGGDGPTPNDPGDLDSGPNRLQNAPVIDSATDQGPVLDVHASLVSTPNSDFEVEFFVSPTCGEGASGDARTWFATVPVTTNAMGVAIFAATLVGPVGDGDFLTATAIDVSGNTSELSGCVGVGAGEATVGLYDDSTATWFLKNANLPGGADLTYIYGPPSNTWTPLSGDWDGDGDDTPGLYDPATGTFFLKNTHASGPADITYIFGIGDQGWLPITGDWDGNGSDTPGLYDPASGTAFLRNSHSSGDADVVFVFGPPGAGWLPIAGDWDGDGGDSVGLYDPASGSFFLKFALSPGPADVQFIYGVGGLGWRPLAGDFDHNGLDSVGLYDPGSATFFLKYTNTPGAADSQFQYGTASPHLHPLIGDWDGN